MSDSFETPWRTVACQAPLSVGFPRHEYWSGCHFLCQGIFLTQGSNPRLLVARLFFTAEPPGKPSAGLQRSRWLRGAWMSSGSTVALSWTLCNQSSCPRGQPSPHLSPSAASIAIPGTPEDGETGDHAWAAPWLHTGLRCPWSTKLVFVTPASAHLSPHSPLGPWPT